MKLHLLDITRAQYHLARNNQIFIGVLDYDLPIIEPVETGENPYMLHHFVYRFKDHSHEEYENFSEVDKQMASTLLHNFLEFKEDIHSLVIYGRSNSHESSAVAAGLDSIFKLDFHTQFPEGQYFNDGLYKLIREEARSEGFTL